MKCIYYLSPSLEATHKISDNLHATGIDDWYIHTISKDEAGLQKEHLHSSNYLETLDLLRDGYIGAAVGFLIGAAFVAVLTFTQPFDGNISMWAYIGILAVAIGFGAWIGGLVGIATENKKLARFHTDIEAGKYLVLIYARKNREEQIKTMMKEQHPSIELVGIDTHFMNPFTSPQAPQVN